MLVCRKHKYIPEEDNQQQQFSNTLPDA